MEDMQQKEWICSKFCTYTTPPFFLLAYFSSIYFGGEVVVGGRGALIKSQAEFTPQYNFYKFAC